MQDRKETLRANDIAARSSVYKLFFESVVGSSVIYGGGIIYINYRHKSVRYPSTKKQKHHKSKYIMKDFGTALSTVDDISQGIDIVDISNNGGTSAAAVCDMTREGDTISEKKGTSCEQKLEHIKTNDIKVDALANDMAVSTCANCGKEGANNICNKCKMVTYCNAACKKKHKTKHKKACERRVAELRDIELFKQLPPRDDCPICFLRLPYLGSGRRYKSCCGKVICSGCIYAPVYDDQGNAMDNEICPFCRIPTPETDEEIIKGLQKRVDAGDAINQLGSYYSKGIYGLPQDHTKALELWKRAAELGYTAAYSNIGVAYDGGEGVEIDKKKSVHYWEQGAIKGCTGSRLALGYIEKNSGNMDRAIKHFMISVADGNNGSLKEIKQLYSQGHAAKDIYTKALRAFQKYLAEIKSSQRDEAAAAYEEYKYIE